MPPAALASATARWTPSTVGGGVFTIVHEKCIAAPVKACPAKFGAVVKVPAGAVLRKSAEEIGQPELQGSRRRRGYYPIEIDGRAVEGAPGTTVLQAARSAGIEIPTLCDDDRLEPFGACRMCMVEIETAGGRKRVVASCVYPIEEGLRVWTKTETVVKIRKMVIELLWPSWQTYAEEYGVTSSRFQTGIADCRQCGRCLRYCAEIKRTGSTSRAAASNAGRRW